MSNAEVGRKMQKYPWTAEARFFTFGLRSPQVSQQRGPDLGIPGLALDGSLVMGRTTRSVVVVWSVLKVEEFWRC